MLGDWPSTPQRGLRRALLGPCGLYVENIWLVLLNGKVIYRHISRMGKLCTFPYQRIFYCSKNKHNQLQRLLYHAPHGDRPIFFIHTKVRLWFFVRMHFWTSHWVPSICVDNMFGLVEFRPAKTLSFALIFINVNAQNYAHTKWYF